MFGYEPEIISVEMITIFSALPETEPMPEANVLDPGQYRLVRSQTDVDLQNRRKPPKQAQLAHRRTDCNGLHRIVALEKKRVRAPSVTLLFAGET